MRAASPRRLRAMDVAVGAWSLAWIVAGVLVFAQVRDLRQLAQTVTQAGTAIERTGAALGTVGELPVIGGGISDTAAGVTETGRSTVESGERSTAAAARLSWALGLVVAIVPTLPLLTLYVPMRISVRRERRALVALLHQRAGDPALTSLLARRALLAMPYAELDAGELPANRPGPGEVERLARSELRRLGVPVDLLR